MDEFGRQDRFQRLLVRTNRLFESLADFCFSHKLLVAVASFMVLGAAVWFAKDVRFDNSFEAYFDREDPSYAEYLKFREDFGSGEISYILYECPEKKDGVWDLSVMRKIQALTRALEEEVPFVREVTSLANAELIEGKDGEILIHEVLDPFPETREEMLALRDQVVGKPLFEGGLASADGKFGAILVEFEKSSVDPPEELMADPKKGLAMENLYPQAPHSVIEDILARPSFSGILFHHTGDVALNANYNEISRRESARLGLIAFSLIGLLLFYYFRRPMGVLGPLGVVFGAFLVSTGFVGAMGWSIDLMFIMLPATLITVGVADSVHILTEYTHFQKTLEDRRAAIRKTMFLVGVPCLFTSLTDVAGFGSTNVSPIKAIGHFAWYSSVGVVAAFLLSVTLFLSALTLWGRPKKKAVAPADLTGEVASKGVMRALSGLSRFDLAHPWGIIAVWSAFFVLCIAGALFLDVDSNFINEFSKDLPIRKTTEYVDATMGGASNFHYIFDSGKPDGVLEPAFLARMEKFQKRVKGETDVVMKTYSLVDLMKDINKSFHDEDPAWHVLPESRELAAQYLLLYEMSGGEELDQYVTADRSRASMEVRCKLVPSSLYKKAIGNINAYGESRFEPKDRPVATGMGSLWIRLINYIVTSQIQSFAIAFGVIAIMMCMVFGSIRLGLLAMVPNIAPVLVTLGVMGWLNITLDYSKLLIASVAIGISVDDNIHFISRFRQEFWLTRNYAKALEAAMQDVGRAVFITTSVLIVGFMVNTFSVMRSIAEFGVLVALTLLVASLADYFFTPALLYVTKIFGPEEK